jgi:energy-coupling factor transport system substrate-specific component
MNAKRLILSAYAAPAAYLYGGLMTLWNWPLFAGQGGALGYVAGASMGENLMRFFGFELATGGILWDTGRAVITALLVWLTAPALLTTLNRAARRAGFEK